MYMYSGVPLLSTRNLHNTVNWLYPNTKEKGFLKKEREKNQRKPDSWYHFYLLMRGGEDLDSGGGSHTF